MIFTAISLRNIQIPFSLARIEERRLNFTISITRQTLLHQVLTFALKMGKKGQNCKIICQFYTLTAAWWCWNGWKLGHTEKKKMPIDKIEVRENQALMLRT